MQPFLKRWRWLLLISLYAALLAGGWAIGRWFTDFAAIEVRPMNEPMIHAMIMTTAVVYVLASATPFVPGAELGFGLLVIFGAKLAALVYGCMVAALIIAYLAGRFIPASGLAAMFGSLGFTRACDLVEQMARLDSRGRLEFLTAKAPHRIVPFLLRHRYLAVIVLLNLPGNSMIGGGGGIAFTAGMSGLFRFPAYLLSVLLAVAPIPLFFVLTHSVE